MRLLILSDLHIEAAPFTPPTDGFDVVVLAGDIHNGTRALQWGRDSFPHHRIVQIAGNHEFYDHRYDLALAAMRERAVDLGIDFLENDRCVIDGVEFLGCTLWTDFRIYDRPDRGVRMDVDEAMQANRRLMADYFTIEVDDPAGSRLFAPDDSRQLHLRSLEWLDAALASPATGPRVVITHHLPSWRSVVPRFARAVSNAAFASDLDDRVVRSDLWIHGHTHSSQRYRIEGAQVVCNARGYPGRQDADGFENPSFEPALVVTVG